MPRKNKSSFGSTRSERILYQEWARYFLDRYVTIKGRGNKKYIVDNVTIVFEPLTDSYAELSNGEYVPLKYLKIVKR
jgi:hypothetical protein